MGLSDCFRTFSASGLLRDFPVHKLKGFPLTWSFITDGTFASVTFLSPGLQVLTEGTFASSTFLIPGLQLLLPVKHIVWSLAGTPAGCGCSDSSDCGCLDKPKNCACMPTSAKVFKYTSERPILFPIPPVLNIIKGLPSGFLCAEMIIG